MKKLDSIIKQYLEKRPKFYAYLRPQEAILFYERIRNMKGPILDFGCGDGFFASTIFKQRHIDVGLDISSSRIDEIPPVNVYKTIKIYDGTTIPFENEKFGTIISNCVFEHIPHIKRCVKEMCRVTKKDGLLITSVMCSSWSNNLLGVRILGKTYSRWFNGIQKHDSLFSKKEWTSLFLECGYKVIEDIDYLHEKTAHKVEIYHYLSICSLFIYYLLKRWNLFMHPSLPEIRRIERLLKTDNKNPSACFFVLRKV